MRPRYNFDFSAVLIQQCGGFQCALATPDHEHLFSSKPSEIAMFRCVRRQRIRKRSKLRRPPSERTDAGSDDHAACKDRLTHLKGKSETFCVRLDAGDLPLIEVRCRLMLVPKSIVDEAVEWYRSRKVIAACS